MPTVCWLPCRLAARLEPLTFRRGQSLHEIDEPIALVYFPRSGVASVVTRMSEGGTLEVATIGNEGFVGLAVHLGDGRSPMDTFVQIPGDAVRLEVRAFRRELKTCAPLSDVIGRYAQALLTQVGQSAACNRVHPADQRCARWLLMSHDRVPGDEIALSQEFLAEMLGIRRASVTECAGTLRRQKLIDYRRARIRILDRAGLERAACECHAFIRAEHDRLVG
jgi:CRP-like cAMP-binding protein